MTTRRHYSKQRHQDRFTRSLGDAREILDDVVEKAHDRDEDVFDQSELFGKAMERIYRQAEHMEKDDE